MSSQWRRLQFFEKNIITQSDTSTRPAFFFDSNTSSLTSTASGNQFVFSGDSKGLIHRLYRQNNTIDQIQAFDAICLHLHYIPLTNILIAIGYDHDPIDVMFNPTLKCFKMAQIPSSLPQSETTTPSSPSPSPSSNIPIQPAASDILCIRTIPLSQYLSKKNTSHNDRPSGTLVTVSSITATTDGTNIALGCDDGSIITVELSKARYYANVWFRQFSNQPTTVDTTKYPHGPITTLHYRETGPNNSYLSLYLTTMTELFLLHQSKQSLTAELLSPEGCHYNGSSLCYNSLTNSTSSLGELVLVCPELTVFYSQEGDRLSCYSFPDKKKFISFYNHFLIIVTDDGPNQIISTTNPDQIDPKQDEQHNNPNYNSPLSRITSRVTPGGRNSIIVYDLHSKIITFSLKCDVIVGLEVLQPNQICAITQRGEIMILTELPLRNKMTVLLKRDLYSVALTLAASQCADKRLVIDITYKYGDYLYNKGDYEAATQLYLDTIGYIEPSVIISKFLFSQHISCLTLYLEELHRKLMITCDHTTLLLTCYTKLHDLKRITTFLLQPHQLGKVSAATPVESLKAIEHLKIFCNSLPVDYADLDNMSQITHIGEYLLRILHEAGNGTNGMVSYQGNNTNTPQRGSNNDEPSTNSQLITHLSTLTTIYSTQHYQTLDLYNTIRVYSECGYHSHALFSSLFSGAHETTLSLLIQLGFYHASIQYIYSLPIHLAAWLVHQFGLQLLKVCPEEVTMLCIKLVCGWKRQSIVHNMVLTIQQDTTTSTTVESTASFDSIYALDETGLEEHYLSFVEKQKLSQKMLLEQEAMLNQPVSNTAAAAATTTINTTNNIGNVGSGLGNGDRTSSMLIEQSIYLRLMINNDGCVSILKCIGFNEQDLTAQCTTNDSQLSHLTMAAISQSQQQQQQQLLQLDNNNAQTPSQSDNKTQGNNSGELSLSDFADDITTSNNLQQNHNNNNNNNNINNQQNETNIEEKIFISPIDFLPIFGDSTQYLRAFLEAVCAHVTSINQSNINNNTSTSQRQRRQQLFGGGSSTGGNTGGFGDFDMMDKNSRDQNNTDDNDEKKSILDNDEFFKLTKHSILTSSATPMNTKYDYLRQLNSSQLHTSQQQQQQQHVLSFVSTLDPRSDVSNFLQFPSTSTNNNTTSSVKNNSTFSSTTNNELSVVPVVISTQVACDGGIWTSLIEHYAGLIRSLSVQGQTTKGNVDNLLTQQSNQKNTASQNTNNNNPNNENKSMLTFSTFNTVAELETQLIQIIKLNIDYIDYSSILIILESHHLEPSLSFLYARTRQFHSLLNLQIKLRDWSKSKQVCQAYGSQEPSLWLFLLIQLVESYPSPDELNGQDPEQLQIKTDKNNNINTINNNNNNNNNNNDKNQQSNINSAPKISPSSYKDLIELLTLCVYEVKRLSLLSPLQIMSLLSNSPYIPIDPIKSFLLDTIDTLQSHSEAFVNDAQSFTTDSIHLQEQIHQLQYEPLVYKSIDCQRCRQQLSMPTIHFYCGHSFHQHCVIENDTSQHQQRSYQQQISSLHDIIWNNSNTFNLLQNNQQQSNIIGGGNNGQSNNNNNNNNNTTTNGGGNIITQNPYSTLLHDHSLSSDHTHQQLLLRMFSQPLEYECPLCQTEHQRLQFIVTSLFSTNDGNDADNGIDFDGLGNQNNNQNNPQMSDKNKLQAQSVQRGLVHDKLVKRLDENAGDFGIIAEQLSRGMFIPQSNQE